jgi:integrase
MDRLPPPVRAVERRNPRTGEPRVVYRWDYTDPRTRGRRSIEGDGKADVEARAAAIWRGLQAWQAEEARPPEERVRVSDAIDAWLDAVRVGRDGRHPVEPATLRHYRYKADRLRRLTIRPDPAGPDVALGDVRLVHLTAPVIAAARDAMLAQSAAGAYGRGYAAQMLTCLKMALNTADAAGWRVASHGQSVAIAVGGRHRDEVVIPSRREVAALLRTAEARAAEEVRGTAYHNGRYGSDVRLWAWVETAVATGCRPSELRGLPRDRLDLDGRRLRVVQRAENATGEIGPPKSKAGYRTLDLSDRAVAALRAWLGRAPPTADIVFCTTGPAADHATPAGQVMTHVNLQRAFRRLTAAAGIPPYHLYSLRHFRASELIADGWSPKAVQRAMGHASISITFDTYGHLFDEDAEHRRSRSDGIAERMAGMVHADADRVVPIKRGG